MEHTLKHASEVVLTQLLPAYNQHVKAADIQNMTLCLQVRLCRLPISLRLVQSALLLLTNVVSHCLLLLLLHAQMDVVYEGPLQLSESQVNTLLGYQNPLNKFINWNITRTKVSQGFLLSREGCQHALQHW